MVSFGVVPPVNEPDVQQTINPWVSILLTPVLLIKKKDQSFLVDAVLIVSVICTHDYAFKMGSLSILVVTALQQAVKLTN